MTPEEPGLFSGDEEIEPSDEDAEDTEEDAQDSGEPHEYIPISEADFGDSELEQWSKEIFFAWRAEFDRQAAAYRDPDDPKPAAGAGDAQTDPGI